MSIDPVGIDRRIDTAMMRMFAESPLHDEGTRRVLRVAAEEIDALRARVTRLKEELDGIPPELIALLREGGTT